MNSDVRKRGDLKEEEMFRVEKDSARRSSRSYDYGMGPRAERPPPAQPITRALTRRLQHRRPRRRPALDPAGLLARRTPWIYGCEIFDRF
ncbi:hypothetical protein EVAR_34442_1 [Eumeta japonica]|uniref:Uncharacterized protein n=1 Tax=Eumeta variegata TaxID=151549 RepID=A0A4C1WJC7_EUMVA|nr:hypothetical protein EVAR_34442_1 [Eumeta japonica]